MQIPCVYLPGPAPAVTVANTEFSFVLVAGGHLILYEQYQTEPVIRTYDIAL
jgi:hypothetical protein